MPRQSGPRMTLSAQLVLSAMPASGTVHPTPARFEGVDWMESGSVDDASGHAERRWPGGLA
jgi:hypothetical protein